jgi:3D (Asp-Asp-Asp) domain-containing protein
MSFRTVMAAAVAALAAAAPASDRADPQRAPRVMRASLYYVAMEGDYPPGRDGAFRDRAGRVLYRASASYVAAAAVEGAALTADGRVLVFDPSAPGEGWRWSRTGFGVDALGCGLVPHRSAAVPPEIPLGSILYIPETVGLPTAEGRAHDGVWFATDRGVGIDGDRIDLFMHLGRSSMAAAEAFGLDYLRPLHVRVVGRVRGCPSAHRRRRVRARPAAAAPRNAFH